MFHGYSVTHLDSLCHVFWDGRMYNGTPAAQVTSSRGARRCAVTCARDGIVTRGVLMDIAGARGVPWLDAGEGVFPDDLEAAEALQGVRVAPGDAVLLRTGYDRRRHELGPEPLWSDGHPGWQAACLPWFHDRGVAIVGADVPQDVRPTGYARMPNPIHTVGIVAMGLWLIDNCDFERLAELCRALKRYYFHFSVAPLRFDGATGSPVNPLASF